MLTLFLLGDYMQKQLNNIEECIDVFKNIIMKDKNVYFFIDILLYLKLINVNKFIENHRPLTPKEIVSKIKSDGRLKEIIDDILHKPKNYEGPYTYYVSNNMISMLLKEKYGENKNKIHFYTDGDVGLMGFFPNNLFFEYTRHYQKQYLDFFDKENTDFKIKYQVENGPICEEIIPNICIDNALFSQILNEKSNIKYGRNSSIISIEKT